MNRKISLKINVSLDLQNDIKKAIKTFEAESPIRFSCPILKDNQITAHPVDLVEIIKRVEPSFENELAVTRLKMNMRTELNDRLSSHVCKTLAEAYQLTLQSL